MCYIYLESSTVAYFVTYLTRVATSYRLFLL